MADSVEQFKQKLDAWGAKIDQKAKGVISSITSSNSTGNLARSFKHRVKMFQGVPSAVVFKLERYGVFLSYGVGRGQGINNQQAGKRVASDWWGKALTDKDLEELQAIILAYNSNLVINQFSNLNKRIVSIS